VRNVAYVIGNGPSRRELDLSSLNGRVYGCNTLYLEYAPDVLVCADPWYQFGIVMAGYPAGNKCVFVGWNPVPAEVPPEALPNLWAQYEPYEVNPAMKPDAEWWVTYAIDETAYQNALAMSINVPAYWQPNRAYICWVPRGFLIEPLSSEVLPITAPNGMMPPSGAYALDLALASDVQRVEVYGFDALVGVWETSSNQYRNDHQLVGDSERQIPWHEWYSRVERHHGKEVIWHT